MHWFAQAPSNIALIKYMGKLDDVQNIPINASLSYTLNNLISSVQLQKHAGKKDIWEPLNIPGGVEFMLPQAAQERYLKHLAFIKTKYNYTGAFVVKSSNNFPHGSGLASSASSFAALTKCAVLALSELTATLPLSIEEQAALSRQGSGSSCRSFFSPWALWEKEEVKTITIPYPQLIHQVIIISHSEKDVSSSEAHRRIRTSPLYASRPERAHEHLELLLNAFDRKDWPTLFKICWKEFQDLHQLFSTAQEPFSYMHEKSHEALQTLQSYWERRGDGPLVTMDAGPNIHLLYRPDQNDMAQQLKHDHLVGNYDLL